MMITTKSWRSLVLVLISFILMSCSSSGGDDGAPPGQDPNKVVANNIEFNLDEDVFSDPIDVLANIEDATYFLDSYTQPTNGNVQQDANGLIIYQPASNYFGDDSFTYTISDGNGSELSATVVVHVAAVNDAPLVRDDEYSLVEDSTGVEIPVLSNDSDIEQEELSVSIGENQLQAPQFGQVSITQDGHIFYVPDPNFTGNDNFQYRVSDASDASSIGNVTVTVFPISDRPVANIGGPYSAIVGEPITLDGSQSFDPDGADIQNYSWDFGDGTSATGVSPSKIYAIPGSYNLQLIVNDGDSDSVVAATTVTVVAEAPFISSQPQSLSIQDGESATFSAQALGLSPLQYQWRENQTNIPGATSATFTTTPQVIPSNIITHQIQYDVLITNSAGQVVSQVATLTINANPPLVVTPPQSNSVLDGDSVSFNVSVSGTAPINLQWRKNGTPIPGATGANFSFNPAVMGQSDGAYDVVVNNVAGSVTSSSAQLTVQARPVSITTQPTPVTVSDGQPAMFTVAASGTQPINFQWRKDGADIAGATSNQLSLPATNMNDNGAVISVVVTNAAGSVTSSGALLSVNAIPPTISTHPLSQTVADGDGVSFSVDVQGSSPLNFQWQRNGIDIPSANASTLSLPSVDMTNNSDSYTIVVSNAGGSVTSNAATLTVQAILPQITLQPGDVSVFESNDASFNVSATGSLPLSFQWRRNGVIINGATGNSHTVTATAMANNGELYDVVVSNAAGTVISNSATLMVSANAAPLAGSDWAITRKNKTVSIDVLANDTDDDGDNLNIESVANGNIGTATVVTGLPDTIEYTSQQDQYGEDTLTYVVKDGKGKSASGTVTVIVTPWGSEETVGSGEGPKISSDSSSGISFF